MDEVSQTLQYPSAVALLEEIADLKLKEFVQAYLPEKWQQGDEPLNSTAVEP